MSIAFGNRCKDAEVIQPTGSVGDGVENELNESINEALEVELNQRNITCTRDAAHDFAGCRA